MVVPAGFEPATSRFGGEHSIQLSYGTALADIAVLAGTRNVDVPAKSQDQANNLWHSSSASIKASTSSVVLYIANDARQVAVWPRWSIKGPVQC
jgi:hypothetical protein